MEARLGSGEGDTAKGPDMKVWNKGRGLTDVCVLARALHSYSIMFLDRLGFDRVLLHAYYSVQVFEEWLRPQDDRRIDVR